MDSEDTKSALDYFKEIDPDVVPHVMNFMSKHPSYSTEYFEPPYSLAEPTAWWRSSLQLGFDKRFVEVALSLVSGTSSSGGLERCFLTLGYTYGNLRTSMGVEKAGKLAFLYRQLNM